jgi:hypothetical protein
MDGVERVPAAASPVIQPVQERSAVARWLLHDSPYVAMLVLALIAVLLRLPFIYWVILVPIFAAISGVESWRQIEGRGERLALLSGLALSWLALLLAILLLFDTGVQGVLNANATSLSMMILLALGTFVAGIQARVWRICAVGGLMFLAVPGIGWVDRSPLLIVAAMVAVIALGGAGWWLSQRQKDGTIAATAH